MTPYQYRKSHCGDNTISRPSYLHNGISYTGNRTSLYWIGALLPNEKYEYELFIACSIVAEDQQTEDWTFTSVLIVNINTLSHKHFVIGVLCYNCFTTSSRGFFPSGAKQLTLPNFILFAMLTLPNIWRACCQFSAKPLSKLWSLYFLLALRNQYGFLNHRGNKI